MSKILGRTNLHNRPRTKQLKRRIRNIICETVFLIILIFVLLRFVKASNSIPKVLSIDAEQQKKIIEEEMNPYSHSKELEIEQFNSNIKIIKALIKYEEENNQTIVSFDVEASLEQLDAYIFLADIVSEDGKTMTTVKVTTPYLEKNNKTRINVVLDGDFRNAVKIKTYE